MSNEHAPPARPRRSSTRSSTAGTATRTRVLGAHPHDGGGHRPRASGRWPSPSSSCTAATARPARRTSTRASGPACSTYPTCRTTGSRSPTPAARRTIVDDAYRYLPTLGEIDLHLINEGRHEQLWDVLGAHVHATTRRPAPVTGTSFAVWAPHAQGVRVKGDFNSWDGREHPMRQIGVSGVWELFVPGVGLRRARTSTSILGADGQWREKADPMAFHTEVAAGHVVGGLRVDVHLGRRRLDARPAQGGDAHEQPMSVYEVHLGSWRRGAVLRRARRRARRPTSARPASRTSS